MNKNRPLQVVISAPSGTGKTTVVQELLRDSAVPLGAAVPPGAFEGIRRSVSFTTRHKKPGEINGRDYYFISKKEFEEKIRRKEFIEYAKVHGYFYGTPKRFLKNKKDIILNIDVQGAMLIKKKNPAAILIFLIPPSFKELKKRLLKRKRDSKEDIKIRLENAKREMKYAKKYDFLVVNDNLKDTVEKLKAIIISERCRIRDLRG